MTVKTEIRPYKLNGSIHTTDLNGTTPHTGRLKAEAELQYTKRRLQTLSRLYEQSCKEIFALRQQLNDAHRVMAKLRTTVS